MKMKYLFSLNINIWFGHISSTIHNETPSSPSFARGEHIYNDLVIYVLLGIANSYIKNHLGTPQATLE